MLEKNKTAGLERIDWLLTTIDWLTRYDAAAAVLCKGGKVDLLLAKAEAKRDDGDKAAVARWPTKPQRFFATAASPRPCDLSLEDDHLRRMGALATINVKAFAAYERLATRIKKLGGDPVRRRALAQERRAADCDADPAEHRRARQTRGSGGESSLPTGRRSRYFIVKRTKSSGRPRQ